MAVGSVRRLAPRAALAALLAFGMAAATCATHLVGVLAPFIVDDLHLSKTSLGLLATGTLAVGAVVSPLAGSLVDRLGGRPMLLGIFAVTATALAGMAAAGSYGVLLLAAAPAGVSLALANPVTNQIVSQHVARGSQGAVIGLKQSGVQAGTFLIGLVPPVAAVLGWRAALLLSAAVIALGLPLTAAVIPATPRRARPARRERARPGPGRVRPIVAQLTTYGFLMGTGTAALGAYLALYAVETIGLPASAGGFAVALLGLAGIASRIAWARRSERAGSASPLLVAMSLCGSTSVALVWAAQYVRPLLWAGALGFGLTGAAWNAVANLVLVRELPANVTGRSAGMVQVGFYGGMAAGPPAFGWLVDRAGEYGPGWLAIVATTGAAAVMLIVWDAVRGGARREP